MSHQTAGKSLMERLPHNSDLLEVMTEIARRENITSGGLMAIGAVRRAVLGYYDQEHREYRETKLDEPMEICSCLGNVSRKDGEIFIHAHIVLADRNGRVWGGHLCPGTIVFAAECLLAELPLENLHRYPDRITGLSLWK